MGFPGGIHDKEPACQCRRRKRCGFDPWVGNIPWRRKWQATPVFLPGESHGQRTLVGPSPWGHRVGHNWNDFARTHKLKQSSWLQKNGCVVALGVSSQAVARSPGENVPLSMPCGKHSPGPAYWTLASPLAHCERPTSMLYPAPPLRGGESPTPLAGSTSMCEAVRLFTCSNAHCKL